MITNTLLFKESKGTYKFCLGIEYNLITKLYGIFLVINSKPSIYAHKFIQSNGLYIYNQYNMNIPKDILNFEKKNYKYNNSPILIDYADLKDIIRDNEFKMVFYTGAGLSKAAGIMDLQELKNSLKINCLNDLIVLIMENHNELKRNFMKFIISLYFSAPTLGHKIIKKLQDRYDLLLITENRDILHQKTGTKVVERDKIDKKMFDGRKLLITWGLNDDHQGIINYLHSYNYRIIAVNLDKPNYLRNSDYWYKSDIHGCLDEMMELI